MPKPISDQVVVIAGASSGTGRASALAFAARGTKVVCWRAVGRPWKPGRADPRGQRDRVAKVVGQTTFVVLHRRRAVERAFSWINRCWRTVRDYERLPERRAAMVRWAMIIIMTRRLSRHQHI